MHTIRLILVLLLLPGTWALPVRETLAEEGMPSVWRSFSSTSDHYRGDDLGLVGHAVAVAEDGSLWTWKSHQGNSLPPVRIGTDTDWAQVTTGHLFSIALKVDGSLWGWGQNHNGQLGNGDPKETGKTSVYDPIRIGTDNDWTRVISAEDHTLALKKDGSLWAWGGTSPRHGRVEAYPEKYRFPARVDSDSTWKQVTTFGNRIAAIRHDGTLWTWKHTPYNPKTKSAPSAEQVGTDHDWVQVSVGLGHTLAIKADGSLWSWGANFSGELGIGFDPRYEELALSKGIEIYPPPTTAPASDPVKVGTDTDWRYVSAGRNHSLAIKADGTLWAWGENHAGQLGDRTSKHRYTPVRVSDRKWRKVWAGEKSSGGIRADGTLWIWGQYLVGQNIVVNRSLNPDLAEQVGTDDDWAVVTAGRLHSLALKKDGSLWAWGNNTLGQLGIGTERTHFAPVRVGTDTDWVQIATDREYSLALKRDGSLWAWGNNINCQLGDGTMVSRYTPVPIAPDFRWQHIQTGDGTTVVTRSDGSLWGWGMLQKLNTPKKSLIGEYLHLEAVSTPRRISPEGTGKWLAGVSIPSSGGPTYDEPTDFVAVHTDGTLWHWNGFGGTPKQVGRDNNWAGIFKRFLDVYLLKSNGELWMLGREEVPARTPNAPPQSVTASTPEHIGNNWSFVFFGVDRVYGLNRSGHLISLKGELGMDTSPKTTWKSASMGSFHAIAIRTDGTLWSWGGNSYGQLGHGQALNHPMRADTELWPPSVLAAKKQQEKREEQGRKQLAEHPLPSSWRSFSHHANHIVALAEDGSFWQWVSAKSVRDGIAIGPGPVARFLDTGWTQVSAGDGHEMALKADSTLWGWGDNKFGQLGFRNHTTDPQYFTPVQADTGGGWTRIFAGQDFTLALKTDGSLWGWGNNEHGQLGFKSDVSPPRYHAPVRIGDATWQQVAVSGMNTRAIRSDGTLWGWGSRYAKLSPPQQIGTDTDWVWTSNGEGPDVAIKADGTLWQWGQFIPLDEGQDHPTDRLYSVPPMQYPPSRPALLVQVGSDTDWVRASSGKDHALALKADGSLWAWGRNHRGQLGDHTNADRMIPVRIGNRQWQEIKAGDRFSMGIQSDGTLWMWGKHITGLKRMDNPDTRGPVARPIGTDNNWKTVSAGEWFSIALKKDGSLWGWGINNNGQVGDGSQTNRFAPVRIGDGNDWERISSGRSHTVALKKDGTLWGWGSNFHKQLGNMIPKIQHTPALIEPNTRWRHVYAENNGTIAIREDGTVQLWGSGLQPEQVGVHLSPFPLYESESKKLKEWADVAISSGMVGDFIGIRPDGTLWLWNKKSLIRIGTENSWVRVFARGSDVYLLNTEEELWHAKITCPGIGRWRIPKCENNLALDEPELLNTSQISPTDSHANLFGKLTTSVNLTHVGGQHIADRRVIQHFRGPSLYEGVIPPDFEGVIPEGVIPPDFEGVIPDFEEIEIKPLKATPDSTKGEIAILSDDTLWTAIAESSKHAIAIRSDGTLWSWGNTSDPGSSGSGGENDYGQLGRGHPRNYPMRVDTELWPRDTAR